MKTKLFFLVVLCFPLFANSQDNKTQQKNPYDVNFTAVTQQEPFFPAGDQALYTYFFKNIHYSDTAVARKITGNVMISFDVMADSTIANSVVLTGVGFGIDDEIVRLLGKLKYAPGIINGQATKMNVILTVPVWANK
jgi:outer membrane biosynthesis protein TonB